MLRELEKDIKDTPGSFMVEKKNFFFLNTHTHIQHQEN